MRHLLLLLLAFATCSCADEKPVVEADAQWGQPLPYLNPFEQVQFWKLDAIRAAYPTADDWVVHEFEGRRYTFCIDELMSLGVARRCLRGWVFSEFLNGWRHIATVHTRGFMSADIVFEEDGSKCVIRASSNNRLKGVDVIEIDLRVL